MNYSSAWFEGQLDGDMRAAQHAKVRRALRMAGVQPGDRVLEIGCGWGALAEMAAGRIWRVADRRDAVDRAA
jgi:cyclopropane-fatty-acyl-phospholipid synthase